MADILNFTKITTLALADSVNPCEIAILAMVLVAIMSINPKNRKKVLYAGLAFTFAVFIGYLFYGLVLIQLFIGFAALLKQNAIYFNKALAIIAIIIGTLNIKDYLMYKPGSFGTEMPLFMRPKVKLIIKKMTSPLGAFFLGFIVTLFLLPCTAGPLLVASGLLAQYGLIKAIPWLLYYNLIFILPMLLVTLVVYYGYKKVEEIEGWKDRNIRKMHLISGLLLLTIGLAIFFGLI